MIGVDTNVLVRYLTADDPGQLRRIDRFIEEELGEGEQLHLDTIVLCEMAWVLRSAYGFSRQDIAEALERLLATRQFSIDERSLVRRALAAFREGKGDFSDHLIGLRNQSAGCQATLTFDRALRSAGAFRLL